MVCIQSAAAKSLQSCLTLWDPIDGSPPGSTVPGILQATTLEWVAISFSKAGKWKVKVKSLSRIRPLATSWTAAHQAPLSMGFSRQEYWSGVPLPSPQYTVYRTAKSQTGLKWFSMRVTNRSIRGDKATSLLPSRIQASLLLNSLLESGWEFLQKKKKKSLVFLTLRTFAPTFGKWEWTGGGSLPAVICVSSPRTIHPPTFRPSRANV